MTKSERKAYRRMNWEAFLSGMTFWKPVPSVAEFMARFDELVAHYEAKEQK